MKLLIYLRSFLVFLIFPLWTIFFAIFVILSGNNKKAQDKLIRAWARGICALYGVTVHLRYEEKIPPGSCMFLFNHTSFFDVFAMTAAMPPFRFGAKIELFKIPFFGAAMRRSGVLPIARAQREKVFRVYDRTIASMKEGDRFALSPEGTRQETEDLGPFKAGPFVFAINAQIPLVPVVIKGAADVLPKGGFVANTNRWHSDIYIDVLDAVKVEGSTMDDKSKLQEIVHLQMEKHLESLEKIFR